MNTSTPFQSTPTTRTLRLRFSLAVAIGGLSFQSMAESAKAPPIPAKLPPVPESAGAAAQSQARNALRWDSEFTEISPKVGDSTAKFTFWFTNASPDEVIINSVRASCGCTTAKLPSLPWKIAPGTNSPIEVSVDLRGKQGVISKTVTVDSTAGTKLLTFKITMPTTPSAKETPRQPAPTAMLDADRVQGMQRSLGDRQVVFKDAQCATCHADPGKGQTDGALLYSSVCANCHDSPQRAELVTDLRALKIETDLSYWKRWITRGRAGSMMPAFGRAEGGPLDERQIAALAAYCAKAFQPVDSRPSNGPPCELRSVFSGSKNKITNIHVDGRSRARGELHRECNRPIDTGF